MRKLTLTLPEDLASRLKAEAVRDGNRPVTSLAREALYARFPASPAIPPEPELEPDSQTGPGPGPQPRPQPRQKGGRARA
jgi:hypothetical protein